MNRTDLINQIAETTGSYKCEVEKFVQAYEEAIIESLRQNKKPGLQVPSEPTGI